MPRHNSRGFAAHLEGVEMYLESGKYQPCTTENERRAVRRSAIRNYKKEKGILYYRTCGKIKNRSPQDGSSDSGGTSYGNWREVVRTRDERQLILTDLHYWSGSGGHLGRDKMLTSIEATYWWPSLYEDVCRFIRSCSECQVTARRRPRQATKRKSQAAEPAPPAKKVIMRPLTFWDKITLELIGPCRLTSSGNQYIMLVTCQSTLWVEAHPLPTGSFEAGIRFLANLFMRHGFPRIIRSYLGRELRPLLDQLCEILNSDDIPTHSYHPLCLQTTQRLNQALEERLTDMTKSSKEWDLKLEQCLFSYRITTAGKCQKSPYRRVFSCDPTLPADLDLHSDDETSDNGMACEEERGNDNDKVSSDENGESDLEPDVSFHQTSRTIEIQTLYHSV